MGVNLNAVGSMNVDDECSRSEEGDGERVGRVDV